MEDYPNNLNDPNNKDDSNRANPVNNQPVYYKHQDAANQTEGTYSWSSQPGAPNYVYPNQAYPGGGYNAPGQPNRGPDNQDKKRKGRTIGLVEIGRASCRGRV